MDSWGNYRAVARLDASETYEWEAFGVFARRSDGQLFWGSEAGDSRDQPFDDDRCVSDLQPLGDMAAFITAGRKWARGAYGPTAGHLADFNKLLIKVSEALDTDWLAKAEAAEAKVTEANRALAQLLNERNELEARITKARALVGEARQRLDDLEA